MASVIYKLMMLRSCYRCGTDGEVSSDEIAVRAAALPSSPPQESMQEIDLKQVTQKERGVLRIWTGFYNFIITLCLPPVGLRLLRVWPGAAARGFLLV